MFESKPSRNAIWAAVVALVWIGLLVGVSLLATPVKFRAPTLELPVALDVGRHTFSVFIIVEFVGLALLALAIFIGARSRMMLAGLLVIVAVLSIQSVWLLPALDARVETYLAGEVPPDSMLHMFYVAAEGAKLLALIFISTLSLRRALGSNERILPASKT